MSLYTIQKFTELMRISLVQDMITFLNIFPSNNVISRNLIPVVMILGSPNLDNKKMSITFGAYSQVYICITNSTKQITVGAIALRPEN